MTTRWIETNGAVLRYELSGGGSDTVVLLHEMGGALESWRQVIPHLSPKYRVLAYDQRGAGLSEKIVGRLTIDDLSNDLAALVAALDLQQPVFLAGSAVGAAVAIHLAARRPRLVRALVAFSPACGLSIDRRDEFVRQADRLQESGPRALRGPASASDMFFPPELRADGELYRLHRIFSLTNDPRSLAAWQRMLATLDIESDFGALDCPALFVGASLDPLRPPAKTRELAGKARRGTFIELPTGHFPTWQTPEVVASTLHNFFAEHAAAV